MSSDHTLPSLLPPIGEKGVGTSDTLRARLEALAAAAIEALDALDAAQADMEPDHDGEAEVDEAWAQPLTLAADRQPMVHRPSVGQMRAAYHRNGDAVPTNLRRFGALFGSGRA